LVANVMQRTWGLPWGFGVERQSHADAKVRPQTDPRLLLARVPEKSRWASTLDLCCLQRSCFLWRIAKAIPTRS